MSKRIHCMLFNYSVYFPKLTIPLLANIYIKADFSDFLFHSLSKDQKKSVIPCVGVFPHIKNKTLLNWLSKKVSLMQKSIKSAVSIVLTALSLSSLSACSALDSFRKVQDDFFSWHHWDVFRRSSVRCCALRIKR